MYVRMSVCMYMYMHAYKYVRMYVCMYVCMYFCKSCSSPFTQFQPNSRAINPCNFCER